MKKYMLLLLVLVSCNFEKPGTNDGCDTVYVQDHHFMDSVFNLKKQRILLYADSVFAERRYQLAKLHQESLLEVQLYREQAIHQVDTMRANFLKLKKTKIYNNLIIKGDTLHKAEAIFGTDSIPKIIFR
jgi:hypothetical protein